MSISNSLLLGVTHLAILVNPLVALPADAAPASSASDVRIDEILVTAERREASLQDTPISMSALGVGDLFANNVKDLQDIAKSVPGLVISSTGTHGHFPFSIRGISPATIGTTIDDPVGIYVDGVYIGRAPGVMTDLFYVDRIEVLRGPQGTLYGRNTSAGAINIMHKRPGDEVGGQFQTSITTEEDFRARAAVDGPIVGDKMRGALAFAYTNQRGWGVNTFDDSRTNSQESYNVYGSLEIAATEDITFIFRADYTDQDSIDGLKRISFGAPPTLDIGDPDVFNYNDPNFVHLKTGGISLTVTADLGAITFESITAYRFFTLNGFVDSDGLATNNMGNPGSQFNNSNDQEQQQFSQEIRLISNSDGPLLWQIGLYGFHENGERVIIVTNFNTGGALHRYSDVETQSVALYGNADYKITPRLTLSAGMRYSYEKKNITKEHANQDFLFDPPRPGFSPMPLLEFHENWDAFTPKLSLLYEVTDDANVYLSAAKGFKSGGFSDVGITPPFGPEEVWSYEGGIKAFWFDRRLSTNLGAFYANYKGLQVNVSIAPSVFQILNAADATLKGLEFEMIAYPFENFEIQAAVAYLDATYDDFLGLGNEQLAGNRLNRAPKWSGNIAAEYSFPVTSAGDRIRIRGSIAYQGMTYFTEQNLEAFSADSWEDVSARVSYESADDAWTFAVFGKNLTDDRHVTNVIPLGGQAVGGFNRPREIGVELSYRF